jgi:hypothetical protein
LDLVATDSTGVEINGAGKESSFCGWISNQDVPHRWTESLFDEEASVSGGSNVRQGGGVTSRCPDE